ncbi:MAG: MBL fold metallo-hydrolase [Bacteroidota bacterium]
MEFFLSILLIISTAFMPSGLSVPRSGPQKTNIHLIEVGGSNVYLLQGTQNILIDSGTPKGTDKIEKGLAKLGLTPNDLALIVLTHGHADHGGGTAYFQEKYQVPVLGGKGDAEMMARGTNDEFQVQSFMGRVLENFVNYPFPPYQADHWLASGERWDLAPYGIAGEVVALPGHTPGSLAIKLESGEIFVGDLIRGSMLAQKQVRLHFFHADRSKVDQQIRSLLGEGFHTFYLGHWGPVSAEEVEKDYPWVENQ